MLTNKDQYLEKDWPRKSLFVFNFDPIRNKILVSIDQ